MYYFTEWVYLDVEKVFVCVNIESEDVIATIKVNQVN
jgi:hypothetical protein